MAKLVFEKEINGETMLLVAATAAGNQGLFVKIIAGVGNKFWWWQTIPAGEVIACDFTNAPTCTDDPAANNTLIEAITATPESVLTYAP